MSRYYYDLHIHSCLSPCADNDNTPNNIAGMAKLSELDIVALTDHNSVKNCPAFFEAAQRYGIVPIAGMELTTSEDIHMICLFERLSDALAFGDEIDKRRMPVRNRPEIFGDQLILDGEDNLIGKEDNLLSVATDLSVEGLVPFVKGFGGICYPAHVDREANGIISTLGIFPDDESFLCAGFHNGENVDIYNEKYPELRKRRPLVSSDAHYLWDIRDKANYFEIEDEK